MHIGEVFLETMSSGIITQEEIDWLTTHQASFSRDEEARALQIGRLLDEGQIQIGCRLLGRDHAQTGRLGQTASLSQMGSLDQAGRVA
ncbi:MAG: hypothetical protein ACKOXO_02520 [Cyanobium sp.]